MRTNSTSETIPSTGVYIALVMFAVIVLAWLCWRVALSYAETGLPPVSQTSVLVPAHQWKGCIDRGDRERREGVIYSLDTADGADAFYIPRVCEGHYELRSSRTQFLKGEVDFINGAVLISKDGVRIGIK